MPGMEAPLSRRADLVFGPHLGLETPIDPENPRETWRVSTCRFPLVMPTESPFPEVTAVPQNPPESAFQAGNAGSNPVGTAIGSYSDLLEELSQPFRPS